MGEPSCLGASPLLAQFREGDEIPRPERPTTETAPRVLRHARARGFLGAPEPRGTPEASNVPGAAEVICHYDVCPENDVYRNGEAAALFDFDFLAPGRRVYGLAQLAKMCCPLDAPEGARRLGLGDVDPVARLRVVADGYGLPLGRDALVDAIIDAVEIGDDFVQRHVSAGEPAFVANVECERGPGWTGASEAVDRSEPAAHARSAALRECPP